MGDRARPRRPPLEVTGRSSFSIRNPDPTRQTRIPVCLDACGLAHPRTGPGGSPAGRRGILRSPRRFVTPMMAGLRSGRRRRSAGRRSDASPSRPHRRAWMPGRRAVDWGEVPAGEGRPGPAPRTRRGRHVRTRGRPLHRGPVPHDPLEPGGRRRHPGRPGGPRALEELCRAYWYPLYAFVRRKGHGPDEAADLTQEYFARLLESGLLARADPSRGRFRAFLRTDCGFFLSHQAGRDRARKRGGGRPPLSIDARDAEGRYLREPADAGLTPDRLFDRAGPSGCSTPSWSNWPASTPSPAAPTGSRFSRSRSAGGPFGPPCRPGGAARHDRGGRAGRRSSAPPPLPGDPPRAGRRHARGPGRGGRRRGAARPVRGPGGLTGEKNVDRRVRSGDDSVTHRGGPRIICIGRAPFMATAAPHRCPSCGAEFPADAPRGHCPLCLIREGLDGPSLSLARPGTVGVTVDLGRRPGPGDDRRDDRPGAPRPAPRHRPRRRAALVRPTDRAAADPTVRYRIDGEIARGGMGAVLRGRDPDLGRDVAIKVLRDDYRDDATNGPPLRRGGPDRRPAPAPRHRPGLRAGHLHRPPAVLLDEAGQGPDPRRAAGRPALAGRRPVAVPRDLRAGGADGRLRPRPRRDPSRPEALERDGRQLRRGPGDGLGPRQGPDPRRRGRRRVGRQAARAGDGHRHGPRGGDSDARRGRTPARSWAPRRTWPPSRPAARSTRSTSGPTSSRSARCSARSSPAPPPSPAGPRPRSSARPPAATTAEALARLDACGADAELVALAKGCLATGPGDRPRDAGAVAVVDRRVPRRGPGAAPGRRAANGPWPRRGRPRNASAAGSRSAWPSALLALMALGGTRRRIRAAAAARPRDPGRPPSWPRRPPRSPVPGGGPRTRPAWARRWPSCGGSRMPRTPDSGPRRRPASWP